MNLAELFNLTNMNLANLLNLTNIEMGLVLIEGSLLLAFFTLFISMRGMIRRSFNRNHPSLDSNQFREWVRESDAICETLSKNLGEKKEIAHRLLNQLDERIQTLQILLKKIDKEANFLPRDGKGKDLDGQILEMAEAGYNVSDIAQRLHLPSGEVQLKLDLRRYSL
jgi:hypothetical protein